MRKMIVAIVMALALMLGACGEPQDEYGAVCVDPTSEIRLEDEACDSGDDDFIGSAVFWYLLLSSNNTYPGVGGKVDKKIFKTSKPSNAKIYTNLSESGGTTKDFKSSSTYKSTKKKSSTSNSGTKKSSTKSSSSSSRRR